MPLYYKHPNYDDDLTVRDPENCMPVVMGDLVRSNGDYWTVSGWNEKEGSVFIAKDFELIKVDAETVGLCWERPNK